MSYDYEHQELEREINNLKRELDDLRYDFSRLKDDLSDKADRNHHHNQYQTREGYYE